jgi:type II secretory pathway predicted ATPase ExeA
VERSLDRELLLAHRKANREGGFALAIGDPGAGKSAALRMLAEHLGNLRDIVVGVLSRPQASLADFYRELGHLFSVPLARGSPKRVNGVSVVNC